MVEFARSREDGLAYFLELNTRTSWTNQLYADAGVDLSQIGYRDMIGRPGTQSDCDVAQIDGIVWLDLRRDRATMQIKRAAGQITTLEWLKSLFRARSYAHWDWRDPVPFVAACAWRIQQNFRKLTGSNPGPFSLD